MIIPRHETQAYTYYHATTTNTLTPHICLLQPPTIAHSPPSLLISHPPHFPPTSCRCAIGSEMSGGMENITVTDCDFTNTGNGLNIKYSKYRGGYVKVCW
jgi:hypothetical protein